jgi:serine phosphatase RsbU (regulator of sigma subunit)
MQRDMREARSIQENLLPPSLPKDERVDIAVSYQPLDEVGGDWYYVCRESDGAISLYISDVSGHGLPAAFISSMTKLAVTASYDAAVDVHLAKTATLLGAQLPPGRFVTMAICRYFPDTGKLQWARAGHLPALVLRHASGEVVELRGDGFPVGFVDDSVYELVEAWLEPGDEILIFTDGVSEVQNRAMKVFGLEQLSSALKANAHQANAANSLTGIVDAIDAFRDERLLKDDITLILLKRPL